MAHPSVILVIIHGADGAVASFCELAKLVNIQLVAVGYQSDLVSACTTIEAFAEMYLHHLMQHYPNKQFIFAGHSFGGLIAYEMAALTHTNSQKNEPAFLLDPNLPLAMRNYTAERILELRVLASSIFPQHMVDRYDIYHCHETQLLALLHRCLMPERLEKILSARKHCLRALSKYKYQEHAGVNSYMIHAIEKLGYDFTDQETKHIVQGQWVKGNHFTMLHAPNVEDIANIINSNLRHYL